MLERLIEVSRYGTSIEELEMVCCMTGFRLRLPVERTIAGSYHTFDLGPG